MGPQDHKHQEVVLDPTVDFIAGTVSGIAGLCVGYPFDTVKVRFQNPEIAHKYHSTFNAISTIVKEERFTGLFRGITSPLAAAAFLNGLLFSSYHFFTKIQLADNSAVPTLTQVAIAGTGCGIVSPLLTTPIELIKIQQQNVLSNSPTAPSTRAVALYIYKTRGLKGLYRGVTATVLRDSGYGVYFLGYEATCRYFSRPSPALSAPEPGPESLRWRVTLLAGAVAGVGSWLATFPFDVVKTRVQSTFGDPTSSSSTITPSTTQPLDPKSGQNINRNIASGIETGLNPYRNTLSTIVHSYRTEGVRVFFRGLAPTLIR